MTSDPLLNELKSRSVGEFNPTIGIDIQVSIPTPLGKCVRINYCLYGDLSASFDHLVKLLGLTEPFTIARGELMGIVKD